MLSASALALLINVGGGVFNWIFKHAGRVVTQVVLFVLALIAALVYNYRAQLPGLSQLLTTAAVIFSLAVAFYEVLLSRFPAFAGPSVPAENPFVPPVQG